MIYKKGFIRKIRNTRTFKGLCVFLIMNIIVEIVAPMQSLALTTGDAQPEFMKFTPIGVSDMVDLSSGDVTYNIPLLDVGGYPINLAYSASSSMDEEASMCGFGWSISTGQINHNVRGLPDDFEGDALTVEDYLKPNITVGGSFKVTANLFGAKVGDITAGAGVTAEYNNYTGFDMKYSRSIAIDADYVSVGFDAESGPDGLSLSPNVSLNLKIKNKKISENSLTGKIGCSFNSRQGLSQLTIQASKNKGVTTSTSKAKQYLSKATGSLSSSIGFTDPVFTPSKRTPMNTQSFSVNVAVGGEFIGIEGQTDYAAFGTIVEVAEPLRNIPSYGYMNTFKAGSDANVDVNREKDGPASVNMTNLAVTNYTYDIHSVQGQGVGGMYRPYQNQVGYVFDGAVQDYSNSMELGLEFGVGNAVHNGFDFGVTDVMGYSGVWNNSVINHFRENTSTSIDYEPVHFKNVGDLSVDQNFSADENSNYNEQMFSRVGLYQPVNIPVVGKRFHRYLMDKYNYFGTPSIPISGKINRTKRQVRNQAIVNVKNSDLQNGIGYGPIRHQEQSLPSEAKGHHIGEVQIIRNDGARYIYGLPAYNTVKKETTFAIKGTADKVNCNTGLVDYSDYASAISSGNGKDLPNDKYFNRVTTPGYVHTHLLTSVLSDDYEDIDNNGPSEKDLGSYTKFSYYKNPEYVNEELQNTNTAFKWRIPLEENKANYNEGLKTDSQDDQGNYVYGEKFMYYVDKIETKTHIAVFKYSPRKDGHGVYGENGGVDENQVSYKLDKISLYSIAEYYMADGVTVNDDALPIKETHFEYDYNLCKGVINNLGDQDLTKNENSNKGGKLTLKRLYFTYRDSKMGSYTDYNFDYNEGNPECNPDYNLKAYDCWGNYKPNLGGCKNTDPITAMEFPYTGQNEVDQNKFACVWNLRKITMPSGGEIDIEYESDDYSYVQDKKVMRMFKVVGAGSSSTPDVNSSPSETLFDVGGFNHKRYLYVEVPKPDVPESSITQDYIHSHYFQGLKRNLIQFRFLMNTTMKGTGAGSLDEAKFDYVSGYAKLDRSPGILTELKQSSSNSNIWYLSVPIERVEKEDNGLENRNPISKATWQFGRKFIPRDVYSVYPNGDPNPDNATGVILDIVEDLFSVQTLNNLFEILLGPNGVLEMKGIGIRFIKEKSYIRLDEPDGTKLGGGSRVKKVKMNDIWEKMNGETQGTNGGYQTMKYGQKYTYKLALDEDAANSIGEDSKNSSGVATYEPVGNKENPFVQPVFSTTKHLLAPDDVNYLEAPFGECFFPSPKITYSRVTVESLAGAEDQIATGKQVKRLHQTGKVVTEFYTSKDFPTVVNQTVLDAKPDKTNPLGNLLKVRTRKHFTGSQGYMVMTNDMDGKEKAKWVYAAGQEGAISGVEYIYNTKENVTQQSSNFNQVLAGSMNNRLSNKVTVIYPDGSIKENNIGVEFDVINDFRENSTNSVMGGVKFNSAGFVIGPLPGFLPLFLPKFAKVEDQFRSAVTTKVINTFGILKETRAHENGAIVSTTNLAWDAMTGQVLVTETTDEYNDQYYTLNYPAHWMYTGMGAASLNIGLEGEATSVGNNIYTLDGSAIASNYLVNGDQIVYGSSNSKGWIYNLQGDQFKIMDDMGNNLSLTGTTPFRIIESGRRNLQSAGIMNVTLMQNPLKDVTNNQSLTQISSTYLTSTLWSEYRIINAGAVDYSDYWPGICECGLNGVGTTKNPYLTNERGVWRTKSSRTFLTGQNFQAQTTGRREGFYTKFSPFYILNNAGVWTKDNTDAWTFVSEVSLFSPYGFELENKDALNRYSAAQYGYNFKFPMAVGANTKYSEIGFDGFEDYDFQTCNQDLHFSFKETVGSNTAHPNEAHTGRKSIKVNAGSKAKLKKKIKCPTSVVPSR